MRHKMQFYNVHYKKHSFLDLLKTTFSNIIKLQSLFTGNINLKCNQKWGNEQTII